MCANKALKLFNSYKLRIEFSEGFLKCEKQFILMTNHKSILQQQFDETFRKKKELNLN